MLKWIEDSIIYQIYPKSFNDSSNDGIGDLQGVIAKLDYLTDLGINAIWLSPIYDSPLDDNGYDISNYQTILAQFGTMDDFDYLLNECHARDIKVIMDLVINHCSDEHQWFEESKKSLNNPYSDYFHWAIGTDGGPPNKWKSVFGGSAWEYSPERDQYYLHIFSKKQPDLNWRNPHLVNEIHTMIEWWLQKGVDGFRIDAIAFLEKPKDFLLSTTDDFATVPCANREIGHGYIKGFMDVINRYNGFSVGEINETSSGGILEYISPQHKEFQMAISFIPPEVEVFHPNLLQYYKEQLETKLILESNNAWNVNFFSNHDKPRQVSLFGDDQRFRADSAKALAVLLLTQKGTPFLYQGEEIGMTNCYYDSIEQYNDLDTINKYHEKCAQGTSQQAALNLVQLASRDNSRTPMQWNAEKFAGFSQEKPWLPVNSNYLSINVESQLEDENSILNHYKKMINLRKSEISLIKGATAIVDENENLIHIERNYHNETIVIIVNLTSTIQPVDNSFAKSNILISNKLNNGSLAEYGFVVYKKIL